MTSQEMSLGQRWIILLILTLLTISCDSGDKSSSPDSSNPPQQSGQSPNITPTTNVENKDPIAAVMVDVPVEDETKYSSSEQHQLQEPEGENESNPPTTEGDASLTSLPCQELWQKRNQIFHDKGYCFPKDTGKGIFGNDGCKYHSSAETPLTDSEREYVKTLRTIEENRGCVKRTELTLVNSATTTVNQPTSTTVLIQYDSPATPFVIQMMEAARDAEKLSAAKASLDALPKPTKGDRKAARKLNDQAITLIKESKDQEALPILEQAHKTDPSDIEITNNLASTYTKIPASDDFDPNRKAKGMLVETLILKSGRSMAWANLGRAFANEGNEQAATNCYINFFRFAENKENALKRLEDGNNETHPTLSKALTNAYSYVKSNLQAEAAAESGK